ncbi:MAG: glycosyltransferase family 4 protein [Candidatus Accumulibacter sp.]|jgi:glycosyltransferase involved in cell wall biosynthesis|nr:glycosyltransferase family 4 protein [Accumulibacter sp.]
MKILFVHQNFPGQYLHLARRLVEEKHQVVFITQRDDAASLTGVRKIVYKPRRPPTPEIHHYLYDTEKSILNAQQVARVAFDLKNSGFVPDLMLGHNGWGEIWYLKDIFPDTPLIGYFEFFYRQHGADADFDPEQVQNMNTGPRIRTKNIGNLLALDVVDRGQTPTAWQKSLYPARYHDLIRVVHEGIDTRRVCPDPDARLKLPSGVELTVNDEVVTYVARNLEAYRGFPSFMRAVPEILERRHNAHVIIVGGDEVSYGQKLPEGQTYRQKMLDELGDSFDRSRVHFLGRVPYPVYLNILRISSAHVYLTYPFVLSWSVLEAMAAGCVVVASDTAPVREVIKDGENGVLVDFFSSKEIAEKTIDVLEAPEEFRRHRENARRTIVETYDLTTRCLPAQLRLLQETVGAR